MSVCLSVRVFVTVFIICLFVCMYVCLLPFFSETSEDISMKFGHKVGIGPKGALKLFFGKSDVCVSVCLSVLVFVTIFLRN